MPLRVASSRPVKQGARSHAHLQAVPSLPYGLPVPPPGTSPLPAGISLCMIVRNEEQFLEAALRSVEGVVDEINIVDTGSTDRTLEIAARFGARIEHREWRNDFAWARNEALSMATRRWILVLDADEQLQPDSRAALAALRDVPAALTGIWVRCLNVSDDYKGTGVSSHALARVFPNNPRLRYRGLIHEFITLDDGETGIEARISPLAIEHYGYLSTVVKERRKAARNYEIIRASTERDPSDPFNWYNLGNTALLDGRPDEGIEALEKMRELVGDLPRGFVPVGIAMLADAYTDFRHDPARAVELARESLGKSPNFANAHFALGRAYAKLQRYDEARGAFEAAIADRPHNDRQFVVDDEVSVWKAHSEIGNAYGKQGDNASALAWFERALANRPGVEPVLINRARALEALDRFDEAGPAFAQVYAEFRDETARTSYVNYLLRRQEYAQALRVLDEAAADLPASESANLLITAATIAQHAGIPPVPYFERALSFAPASAVVLAAYDAYLEACGDAAARAHLRARELEAPCVEAEDFTRRASRFLREGRLTEAAATARAGLAVAPQHAGLTFDLAAAEVQLGNRAEALDLLRGIPAEAGPVSARAAFLRSVIAYDLGCDEEALAAIDAALEHVPADIDGVLHRARILERLGSLDAAENALRSVSGTGEPAALELATFLLRQGRTAEAAAVADCALAGRGGA